MSIHKILLNLFVVSLIFGSCTKDKETFTPLNDSGLVESILIKINDRTESYVIDASKDHNLLTASNSVLSIAKGSFLNENNEPYIGDVKILFTDIRSAGQTILTGSSTDVNGVNFYSKSMVRIDALDGNRKKLKLNEGQTIKVYHPSEDITLDPNLKIFRGGESDGAFDWLELSDPVDNYNLEIGDWNISSETGSIVGHGYKYSVHQLGWHGVGDYLDDLGGTSIELCVQMPNLFNKANTKVFFVFEDLISIVNLQAKEDKNNFCSTVHRPSQQTMSSIITISSTENGDYYLGSISSPDPNSTSFDINPEIKTLEEITDFLIKN